MISIWPPNFPSREFDCIDRGGYFGPAGSLFKSIEHDAPKDVAARAFLCAWALQSLRDEIGLPLVINSAWRPLEYNRKVGSRDTSQHVLGWAVDIRPPRGWDSEKLFRAILARIKRGEMPQGGVGVYPSFVHYDMRGRAARWRVK